MKVDAVIIGGTGMDDKLGSFPSQPATFETPFGQVTVKIITLGNHHVGLMNRHGDGHHLPPHLVPYQANALACVQLAPFCVFATAAVGSIRHEWRPGTLVLCQDTIDFSSRNLTLFNQNVQHTDMSDLFNKADSHLAMAMKEMGLPAEFGTYLNVNGPRYETPAEIRTYRGWGADMVGMTAGTEAIIMREAGLKYECLAIITNMAAGMEPEPLSHPEVSQIMQTKGQTAFEIIQAAIAQLPHHS